jgi:hypothetical protein
MVRAHVLQQETGIIRGNSKAQGGRRGSENRFGVPQGRDVTVARSDKFGPFNFYIEWARFFNMKYVKSRSEFSD